LWCNLHGHGHPRIQAAIAEQLYKLAHATTLGMSNVPAIELARRLAQLAPGELNHVFYSSDGACAVEAALKIAFQYWRQAQTPRANKKKFVAFDSAYHGDTLGSTAVGGIERFHALYKPLLFDVIRLPPPDRRRGDAQAHLGLLERVLDERHEEIAALVIEPILQGAAGMILQPPGYLRGVRELTKRYNVLLIADEIVTGFGRTGRMFACEQEGVTPDLLCLGKSLTSGCLPMAATIATDEIYDAFLGEYTAGVTFHHGHTFGGNPLAAAAAIASLDLLDEDRMLETTVPRLADMMAGVLAPLAEHPHVGEVRQLGTIAGVELMADRASGQSYPANERRGYQACKRTTANGVWLRPLGDVVVVMPPLVATEQEVRSIGSALGEAIDFVCGN
jgi:adenosylmethionine-8-amino-7-oxononanoate aminotransferase